MSTSFMVGASSRSAEIVQSVIDRAARLRADSENAARIADNECHACYYVLGRLGGCAMTTRPCMCCGKDVIYGNTSTDVLCADCAKQHSLCKHCGGDLEMRARRRKWPKPQLAA